MDASDPNAALAENGFLPAFANEENKKLNAAILDLRKHLEELTGHIEQNQDSISVMSEHLKNVQQELTYTESRVEANKKEIETENHLKQLADREFGRVKKDVDKLAKERLELQDKINNVQQQIFKKNEKLEEYKSLIKWNQEELDQWAEAQKQKEDDNAQFVKFTKADQVKIRELEVSIERLTQQVSDTKRELEDELTETQAAQTQLDKAAEDFRALHQERQQLIRQWDDAVEGLRQRDEAILLASEQFAAKKAELRQLQAELDGQARFLENEQENNKELTARIEVMERVVAKRRDTYMQEQRRVADMNNEVELLKSTLSKAANVLAQKTAECNLARETLERKRANLDALRKKHAGLTAKLTGKFGELDTLESQIAELEGLLKAEVRTLEGLRKDKEGMEKERFVRAQELLGLRSKERDLLAEISGSQSQNKALAGRILGLDDQVVRQQELLYSVEFQMAEMERKISRAQGKRSDDEARALNARIEKLTAMLENVNAEHAMLLEQVKHAEEDLLQARRESGRILAEKARLDDKIIGLKQESEGVMRAYRIATDSKERHMVEADLMKLEVKRLRDVLASRADEVSNLENRKFQLKMNMEERKHEVEVHKEALKVELRLMREDVHRVTMELKDRSMKVEKLVARFETISTKSKPAEEGGETKTQAYYVVQAALERESLQKEGDELDSKIRKAEKEVTALEATLGQLVNVNSAFHSTVRGAADKSLAAEQAALRSELDVAYDNLKARRAAERQLAAEVEQAEARLSGYASEQAGLQSLVADLGRRRAELEAQLREQADKQQRAAHAARRLQRAVRARAGLDPDDPSAQAPAERDVALAEVRETNRSMLQEVQNLSLQFPELNIAAAFEASGVKLPSAPTSLAGSRASSRAASVRSGGSVRSTTSSRGGAVRVATIGF